MTSVALETSPYLYATWDCVEHYQAVYSTEPGGGWSESWRYQDVLHVWRLGLAKTAGGAMAMPNGAVNRLFGPYDRLAPFEGGLGMSRRDVGCLLARSVPDALHKISGYSPPGGPGVSHVACDFHYTRAWWDQPSQARYVSPNYTSPKNIRLTWWGDDGNAATPIDDPVVTRLRYKPGFFALWVPDDPARVAADDWDLAPAREPRATALGCPAVPPRSLKGGGPTKLLFLNVSGKSALVYLVKSDGTRSLVATVPTDKPVRTNIDTYHPVTISARAGQTFSVTDPTGTCLGVWSAPSDAYSLAEIHPPR